MHTSNRPENIFAVSQEEIQEHFQHVLNNQFETRTIVQGEIWQNYVDKSHGFFSDGYTKGHSTAAILKNSKGEKDFVEFWKTYKDRRVQYGYSFKKRELFPTILN